MLTDRRSTAPGRHWMTSGYTGRGVKRGIVVAVLVILLLAGLPVLVGMGGMTVCADCDLGIVGGVCLAFLAAAAAVGFLLLHGRVRLRHARVRVSLFAFALERPPQLV